MIIRTLLALAIFAVLPSNIDAETPLLAWGILDSMSLIRLTAFIEDDLRVIVPSEELADSSNLENLAAITRMVEKHASPA